MQKLKTGHYSHKQFRIERDQDSDDPYGWFVLPTDNYKGVITPDATQPFRTLREAVEGIDQAIVADADQAQAPCDHCGEIIEAKAHRTNSVVFHKVKGHWTVCKGVIDALQAPPTCYKSAQPVAYCSCEYCTRKRERYIDTYIVPCAKCGVIFDCHGGYTKCPPCTEASARELAKRENIRHAQNRWIERQSKIKRQ